jgi:hypothetical protein
MFVTGTPIVFNYTIPKIIRDSSGNLPTDTWDNVRGYLEKGDNDNVRIDGNQITITKPATDFSTGIITLIVNTNKAGEHVLEFVRGGSDTIYKSLHTEVFNVEVPTKVLNIEVDSIWTPAPSY